MMDIELTTVQVVAKPHAEAYWVDGGVFATTEFDELAEGAAEEVYGPFETYEQAFEVWSARSRQNIDICCYRLFIVPPLSQWRVEVNPVVEMQFGLDAEAEIAADLMRSLMGEMG